MQIVDIVIELHFTQLHTTAASKAVAGGNGMTITQRDRDLGTHAVDMARPVPARQHRGASAAAASASASTGVAWVQRHLALGRLAPEHAAEVPAVADPHSELDSEMGHLALLSFVGAPGACGLGVCRN